MAAPIDPLPGASRPRSQHALALGLALALALAPTAAFAQDDEDDFLRDDYSGVEPEDEFSDDFLEEDYTGAEVEEKERGLAHWAFYVPVDVLLARPFALNDTIIGGSFLIAATPLLALLNGGKSVWDWAWGEGWYFERGNLQAAKQICFDDPFDYLWDRPLGQLTSEY